MEIVNIKNWRQDKNGKWWYYAPGMKEGYRVGGELIKCAYCGKYSPKIPSTRKRSLGVDYCSRECGTRGTAYRRARPGSESHNWRGGRHVTRGGYVDVYSKGHPYARGGKHGKYVKEHRLVMEKHIERYLLPTEHVHHKNGIRDDNRLENLELWSNTHPYGIRSIDSKITCPHCNKKFSVKDHQV
jgi:hypothetical protein